MKAELELSESDKIFKSITEYITVKELIELVRECKDKSIYILLNKEDREFRNIHVDSKEINDFENMIVIPVPKRFAVLEEDEEYFERTLKANIELALRGEKEFYK